MMRALLFVVLMIFNMTAFAEQDMGLPDGSNLPGDTNVLQNDGMLDGGLGSLKDTMNGLQDGGMSGDGDASAAPNDGMTDGLTNGLTEDSLTV